MQRLEARFKLESWDEKTLFEGEGGQKTTHAHVVQSYSDGLDGTGVVEYLMAYVNESEAEYVGIERFEGSVEGRSGSFIMRHEGTFSKEGATSRCTILQGSGLGDLKGIHGTGHFPVSGHAESYPFEFSYQIG
jgi:hypothetical protein